jgi:hypothetical protein
MEHDSSEETPGLPIIYPGIVLSQHVIDKIHHL